LKRHSNFDPPTQTCTQADIQGGGGGGGFQKRPLLGGELIFCRGKKKYFFIPQTQFLNKKHFKKSFLFKNWVWGQKKNFFVPMAKINVPPQRGPFLNPPPPPPGISACVQVWVGGSKFE